MDIRELCVRNAAQVMQAVSVLAYNISNPRPQVPRGQKKKQQLGAQISALVLADLAKHLPQFN